MTTIMIIQIIQIMKSNIHGDGFSFRTNSSAKLTECTKPVSADINGKLSYLLWESHSRYMHIRSRVKRILPVNIKMCKAEYC